MRGLLAIAALATPLPVFAQAGQESLRELSTDRPDKTESPYTVNRGHVQIEMDLATYTHDHEDDLRTRTVSLAPVNLKLGIDRDTDLQVIVEPYLRRTETDAQTGARDVTSGFGDVTVRLKHNLWGNDGGSTALAVMPFVKLPTAAAGLGNGAVEFGIIVPLAVELSEGIGVGLMTELDIVEQEDGGGRRASFVNSATVSFDLGERLALYTELFTERGEGWVVTGDFGFTYVLRENTQIDTGANIGLSDAADDLMVFVGLSRRF
jgi:hypothetical protein